jgi:hypothetical protein
MSAAGRYSVVDELVNANPVILMGEGELIKQPDQEGVPDEPGRVQFELRYAPMAKDIPHGQTIELGFRALDEAGARILRWQPASEGKVPLPRYDLAGMVELDGEGLRIHIDTVFVDYKFGSLPFAMMHHANKALVGEGLGSEVVRIRAIVPNLLAPSVETSARGLQVRLESILPDAQRISRDPKRARKVLPTHLLHLGRPESTDEAHATHWPDMGEAVETLGWFLSFYAGRAVHPSAWDGEAEGGRVWCVQADAVDPLPSSTVATCLRHNDLDSLEPFLTRACESWLSLSDQEQKRLRGVVNAYRQMLAAAFATQQVALTAIYLERLRELVVGDSDLLPVTEAFAKSKRKKVESELRAGLREVIDYSTKLDEDQKETLKQSLESNSGKIRDVLRKSFKDSLLELYDRADLSVDRSVLSGFIRERDNIIHGTWDASRDASIQTYYWAEYGLNLLERLMLRFFGYEGQYWDRVTKSFQRFEHRDPTW